jgi:hypothetical protein
MKYCGIITEVVLKLIVTLITGLLFAEGVLESIYVHKSRHHSDGCDIVHTQILVYAIIDIFTAVVFFENLITSFQNTMYRDNNFVTLVIGIKIFAGIWAVNTYHKMGSDCYNFWQIHAPELLTFVKIHYAECWIIIGFILISWISGCVYHYITEKKKRQDDERAKTVEL